MSPLNNGQPGKWNTVNITVVALTSLSLTLAIIPATLAFIAGAMTSSQNVAELHALQATVNELRIEVSVVKSDTARIREDISEIRVRK